MMLNKIILSIFPGIDLLGRAFEEIGFCVVRGPDLLWGGDIKSFHPVPDIFDGVIGGPPCQFYSSAAIGFKKIEKDMMSEFVRVVEEAQPSWFIMENTRRAPIPSVEGYHETSFLLNNRWLDNGNLLGPEQNRVRLFVFGCLNNLSLRVDSVAIFQHPNVEWCVTATEASKGRPGRGPYSGRRKRRSIERLCELMGLPGDFFGDESPFTIGGKGLVLGNGVPLPMGRAVAKAIKKATEDEMPVNLI